MAKLNRVSYTLLYVTIALLVFCWIAVVTRITVRRWKNTFGLDDNLMCIGLILYTTTGALVIVCCFYGAGQHSSVLSADDIMQGTKLFWIAEFFYASCTVPIKASICVCLLRIADARRRFVWVLWGLVALCTITAIVFILAIANLCHPITKLWGETEGVCWLSLNSSVSFYFSAVSILTDWTLAIMPGFLLWKIQMKARVKISVGIMLSLAAFASCATIVRLRYLTLYNDQSEFVYSTGAIGLWSVVEEGIGIIAGSMPALRPLLNLPIFGGHSTDQGESHQLQHSNSQPRRPHRAEANQFSALSEGRESQENIILKETQWTISTETHEAHDWSREQVVGWRS